MRAVTLASIRAHLPRLIASTLAIVIAVGYVVATLVLNATTKATVLEAVGAQYVDADAVVTSDTGEGLVEHVDTLTALDGVQAVDPTWQTYGQTGAQYLEIESVAGDPQLRWQQLTSGALPVRPGEIAVSERVDAAVGDVVAITVYDDEGTETTTDATVTGVVDLGGDPTAATTGRAYATADQTRAWGAQEPVDLRIAGTTGTDPDALVGAVSSALSGADVTVRTGTEQAEASVATITGDAGLLTAFLLVFATIAVLVAGLVIANTFAVLLAQRTRDLALLRCVGATARQVRRSVLGEAVLTGLAASVLGVLAGIGLAAAISAVVSGMDSPIPLSGLSVPPSTVLIGLAVGTVTTLIAALAPARAATRVAPLAALRPTDPAPLRSRGGVARLVTGLLLAVAGIALMVLGVTEAQVLVALGGIVLSSLGLLLLAQRAVPPIVAAAGRLLGRLGGLPARLATGNATRNPRRTAATATALLIGVTLTTAMVVGASSTRATAQEGLAAQYPTDVTINTWGDAVPSSLQQQLASVDGVVATTSLATGVVTDPEGYDLRITGVDPAAARPVLRSTSTTLPEVGQIVVPEYYPENSPEVWGGPVTLTSEDRSLTLTPVVGGTNDWLVNDADLQALVPEAAVDTMWLRLADDADQTAVIDEIAEVTGNGLPSAFVTGLASERAMLDQIVDALLLIVTGLLGVAVLIALIGVGNTLALSVVERRQESGLLRALGLTRGQLRALLAWEAVLVAGVAAVLGVLVGSAYGLVGTAAMLSGFGEVVIAVPWLQVGAIVLVATVAGLLASVLPARRAAKTPPVAAIAG
ncbi:FtsX-like permease family protein [Modestobacter sp. VKM Ac-2979]|uniref:ABC transporter permease n=1 Tax=unclassified Modestobacter TaxID=2643866 RepID=UPI0022ABC008|nr:MULTISPECIES: FtsX-like permease family protein [unclassified Modestobacter]MCZ2813235.1 FtsX-like permease family protein [Modestobacter sp. VKM Ac-2979]MCZ2844851.1 FtsX-like permease family protein [Modestobacter sp. VKM Ac-2980]